MTGQRQRTPAYGPTEASPTKTKLRQRRRSLSRGAGWLVWPFFRFTDEIDALADEIEPRKSAPQLTFAADKA